MEKSETKKNSNCLSCTVYFCCAAITQFLLLIGLKILTSFLSKTIQLIEKNWLKNFSHENNFSQTIEQTIVFMFQKLHMNLTEKIMKFRSLFFNKLEIWQKIFTQIHKNYPAYNFKLQTILFQDLIKTH